MRVYGVGTNIYEEDIVTLRSGPLNTKNIKRGVFYIVDTVQIDGRQVIQVRVDIKKHRGDIYIDSKDYSIIKYSYSFKKPYLQEETVSTDYRLYRKRDLIYRKDSDDKVPISSCIYKTAFQNTIDESTFYIVGYFTVDDHKIATETIKPAERLSENAILIGKLPIDSSQLTIVDKEAPPLLRQGWFKFAEGLRQYQVVEMVYLQRQLFDYNITLLGYSQEQRAERVDWLSSMAVFHEYRMTSGFGVGTRIGFAGTANTYTIQGSYRRNIDKQSRWHYLAGLEAGYRRLRIKQRNILLPQGGKIDGESFDAREVEVSSDAKAVGSSLFCRYRVQSK